jgi:hypothetical protein
MRTVKSAKIALFFKEGGPSLTTEKIDSSNRPAKSSSHADRQERQPSRQPHNRPTEDRRERQRDERPSRPEREIRDTSRRSSNENPVREARDRQQTPRPEQPIKPRELLEPRGGVWNEEMMSWVSSWVKQSLEYMGRSDITFSFESSRNHLRIDFTGSITGDEKKERMLFSSFAHLIMSSLRNKFKGDLKHLKVILNSK